MNLYTEVHALKILDKYHFFLSLSDLQSVYTDVRLPESLRSRFKVVEQDYLEFNGTGQELRHLYSLAGWDFVSAQIETRVLQGQFTEERDVRFIFSRASSSEEIIVWFENMANLENSPPVERIAITEDKVVLEIVPGSHRRVPLD